MAEQLRAGRACGGSKRTRATRSQIADHCLACPVCGPRRRASARGLALRQSASAASSTRALHATFHHTMFLLSQAPQAALHMRQDLDRVVEQLQAGRSWDEVFGGGERMRGHALELSDVSEEETEAEAEAGAHQRERAGGAHAAASGAAAAPGARASVPGDPSQMSAETWWRSGTVGGLSLDNVMPAHLDRGDAISICCRIVWAERPYRCHRVLIVISTAVQKPLAADTAEMTVQRRLALVKGQLIG